MSACVCRAPRAGIDLEDWVCRFGHKLQAVVAAHEACGVRIQDVVPVRDRQTRLYSQALYWEACTAKILAQHNEQRVTDDAHRPAEDACAST
jgi:hypothetical protein